MTFLYDYIRCFYLLPYGWGKQNGYQWDCSGFVQEILKAAGIAPPGDNTAQSLYNHFEKDANRRMNSFSLGALAFYGQDINKITHVAFCLDAFLCVEAGGGGKLTVTVDDARSQEAFVRLRPIKKRKDFLCTIKPSYASIGYP